MKLTERDLEYRAALGLTEDDPLPKELGQCYGHCAPASRKTYYRPEVPPRTNLGACNVAIRNRRLAQDIRVAGSSGDVEADLIEYGEAIRYAEDARDNARTKAERSTVSRYVIKLRHRRDALLAANRDRIPDLR